MPEITALHIALLAGTVAAGVVIGWVMRGSRCAQEKVAVNEGWQQQLEAQRVEHDRLLDQNKNLMEQVSQLQASGKDATNRARELSDALKEAFERRDELQRELKDIRSNLEVAVQQREKLQSDMKSTEARGDSAQSALKAKDDKIFRLSRELENWQNRLPPLIERFRERDEEAARLEDDLQAANDRVAELEAALETESENRDTEDETRIEPVDPEALGDELDASNDPSSMTQTGINDVLAEDENDATEFAQHLEEEVEDNDQTELTQHLEEEVEDDDQAELSRHLEAEVEDDEAESEPDEVEDADASAEVAALSDQGPGAARDDLKLIKGIGPAIEKTLNELGICRFDQIADMSEYDIDRVAQRLKGFRTRIYREDWIGQARDLQLQKTAN
jgi:predicted flap endonuclease-1-like 5' DNA nuclease